MQQSMKYLDTLHGQIQLPAFLPDATRAVVKGGLDSVDLRNCGIESLVINTLHLSDIFNNESRQEGDIHRFMGWQKPIVTDSGGFQVLSLIHNNPKKGEINDRGVVFYKNTPRETVFDAEQSIQIQLKLGADILICLDDCTKPDAPFSEQEKSIERTVNWAKRCKNEFLRLTENLPKKPLIFAVIQGGNSKQLRQKCADELLKIGFDGYCYGGFPVNSKREFLSEILSFTAKLIPNNFPKYAMGVGKPENIAECIKMGYNLFDCVIPTREARHKKLYVFSKNPKDLRLSSLDNNFYSSLYLYKNPFRDNPAPISPYCDCHTCQNFSLSYLYHLFKIRDLLAFRLATIHNLRFFTMLLDLLKPT